MTMRIKATETLGVDSTDGALRIVGMARDAPGDRAFA